MAGRDAGIVEVSLKFDSETIRPVGRLAMFNQTAVFEWDESARDLPISPLRMPFQTGLIEAPQTKARLHGVFADCLPDAWGRMLLDSALRKAGKPPEHLSPLERLHYLHDDAMGALQFSPRESWGENAELPPLDRLAENALQIAEGASDVHDFELICRLGGSAGGMRPKLQVYWNGEDISPQTRGTGRLASDMRPWIVKFATRAEIVDAGAIEYVYAQIARSAGLKMPDTALFPSQIGSGWFATARFDRKAGAEWLHFLSLAGLLDLDFGINQIGYEDLLKAIFALTRDVREVEAGFRAMVFNIVMNNCNDHSKNFGFLMNRAGEWRLAPSYDLTFSEGRNGEHRLHVAGEARAPSRAEAMRVADLVGLKPVQANAILDEVLEASGGTGEALAEFGVSRRKRDEILARIEANRGRMR